MLKMKEWKYRKRRGVTIRGRFRDRLFRGTLNEIGTSAIFELVFTRNNPSRTCKTGGVLYTRQEVVLWRPCARITTKPHIHRDCRANIFLISVNTHS
jgi:hypothetical protein